MSLTPTRLHRAAALVVIAVVTLAACSSGPGAVEQPTPASAASAKPVSGADMAGHVHNLAYDGRRLLIGTHEGLWEQAPGAMPAQVSDEPFDVMGFTPADDSWLASGHPGEGMDAPADLGLMRSTDQGRTWTEVSLGGDVDFHRLAASSTMIIGINAADGALLRSDDGGESWANLGTPGLYDLTLIPTESGTIVGTTENGPVRSTDAGATFQPLADTPLLALLAWAGNALYAADVNGQVLKSTDNGTTWTARGSLPAQPTALAATGTTIAALVDGAIVESLDEGTTFAPRITDIAGH